MRNAFLPDELRPVQEPLKRSPRLRILGCVALVVLLISSAPLWCLRAIDIDGREHLPEATARSLDDLVGCPLIALRFDWVRTLIDVWPQVGSVDLHFELTGVLRIRVRPAVAQASVPVGRAFHGVTRDGSFAGRLDQSKTPLLVSFPSTRSELRQALAVADRLEKESHATVLRVRRITPADLEVILSRSEEAAPVVVRVTPNGSRSESVWCQAMRDVVPVAPWSDLRRDDRIVEGGLS